VICSRTYCPYPFATLLAGRPSAARIWIASQFVAVVHAFRFMYDLGKVARATWSLGGMEETWFTLADGEEVLTPDSWSVHLSSPSSAGPSSAAEVSSLSAVPEHETVVSKVKARRRPIPRKGHTKSRRGCYNCKRRKVKCQETLPACEHCTRIGLSCRYPPIPTSAESHEETGTVTTNPLKLPITPVSSLSSPSPSASLNSSPTKFSMDDLRFFAHFLHTAYPPLPLRGDAVWQGVAALSHAYPYLVHAMLGLAASHLSLLLPDEASTPQIQDFAAQGLSHRVTAIRLLNESLSSPCTSQAEADARFAAIMSLTFQASYLPEGMFEFLAMVRGCQVVAGSAMLSGGLETGLFKMFSPEGHYETVQSLGSQQDVPTLDSEKAVVDNHAWIEGALASLKTLAPNCKSPMELKYLLGIERAVRFARTSNAEGKQEPLSR
jgi:hypothetical protein